MIDANREYVLNKVLSASPVELVRILYETALDSVKKAISCLHNGEVLERGRAISRATEAIGELRASLHPVDGSDYSSNLAALYVYVQRQLFRAHIEKSEPILAEISHLLSVLLEGWVGATTSREDNIDQADSIPPPKPG